MSNRTKQMGRPVDELSLNELKSEKIRCETLLSLGRNSASRKRLNKRLRLIKERLRAVI